MDAPPPRALYVRLHHTVRRQNLVTERSAGGEGAGAGMGVGAVASSIIGIEGVGAGVGAGASASLSVALTSDLLRTPARAAAIIEPFHPSLPSGRDPRIPERARRRKCASYTLQ